MTSRILARSSVTLAALLLCGGGCITRPDRGSESYIVGLRVMDIKAEPPEVPAGQMTTLSALVADTAGRPIDIAWAYCDAMAPMGADVNSDCVLNDASPNLHAFGTGMSTPLVMPTIDPAILGSADRSGGIYVPIRAKFTAGTDSVTAIYKLRLGMTGGTPNQNPTLTGIYQVMVGAATPSDGGTVADGGAMANGSDLVTLIDPANAFPVHTGDKLTLRALLGPGSVESYMTQGRSVDGGAPQMRTNSEQIDITWFATAGTLSDSMSGMSQSGTTTADMGSTNDMGGGGGGRGGMGGGGTIRDAVLTVDANLPVVGGVIELWAVGRDNRGGSDFQHRTLLLQ